MPGENHRPVGSHCETFSHNVVFKYTSPERLTISMVIGTDCIGSCNYHTITPRRNRHEYIREKLEGINGQAITYAHTSLNLVLL